ncbi:hypothetical protein [Candidatus Nephthysia bennettiae]|uniref:hypothetical protein n=1 Tax=Candidatus Nephthysia bennettiae TaxID=3127016 RepID=UPI0030C7377A
MGGGGLGDGSGLPPELLGAVGLGVGTGVGTGVGDGVGVVSGVSVGLGTGVAAATFVGAGVGFPEAISPGWPLMIGISLGEAPDVGVGLVPADCPFRLRLGAEAAVVGVVPWPPVV